MKIFIIRHGETTSDIENRYGGDYDDHLTERGKTQAGELAVKLSGRGIRKIFSSPLIRAVETLEILNNSLDCEQQIVEELRERNSYGVLTGMKKEEARRHYPDLTRQAQDYHNTIEGGESYDDFLARVKHAYEQISNVPHESIAVISHGGLIKCLFRDVLKFGDLADLADCAFIEIEDGKVILMEGASFVDNIVIN